MVDFGSALRVSGLYGTFAKPSLALLSVTSRSGKGVYASSDTLYKGAVFGRDSLEVAEDLIELKPRLVSSILTTLASLQGTTFNSDREEEPGKIVHEYRNIVVDGKVIDDSSMAIFKKLSSIWGGDENEMAYYGSIDATPHFLRVLDRYCELYGTKILDKKILLKTGEVSTMGRVALNATDWLVKKVSDSRSGMLEYKKVNPHGISNQVWKDSEEFYVHENGQLANHNLPIASIEVQGLACDALLAAARIINNNEYIKMADSLRDATINKLWLPEKKYFALGLDYSQTGEPRIIKTLSANQAALLDTKFFDDLSKEKRREYVAGIIGIITSQEFLTDAGIRSRALSESKLIDHWDYHGSFVSWAKETYDIAKGMRRQGFPLLARQLENRILNVCLSYKAYPEFVYVDGKGRVLASPPSSHSHGEFTYIEGTNKPERVQAWTVSAVMAIVSSRIKNKLNLKKPPAQSSWQQALEKQIIANMPYMDRHINPVALKARYPSYSYKVRPK